MIQPVESVLTNWRNPQHQTDGKKLMVSEPITTWGSGLGMLYVDTDAKAADPVVVDCYRFSSTVHARVNVTEDIHSVGGVVREGEYPIHFEWYTHTVTRIRYRFNNADPWIVVL